MDFQSITNSEQHCISDRIFDSPDLNLDLDVQKSTQREESTKDHKLSPRIHNMIEDSVAVQLDTAKETGTLGFLNNLMVQATLPHTKPTDPETKKELNYYERTNGIFTLSVMSRPKVGIPYGSMPRTLLAWICTEAVKSQSKTLYLGSSQAEFLREKLNLHTSGQYTSRLKDQAYRLFNSLITVENTRNDRQTLENTIIARKAVFWNPAAKDDQRNEWQTELTLSTDFYDDITAAPVPTDLRILHSLRKSPLAMDIYTWLCYRQFLMSVKGDSVVRIPWEALRFQFGSNYNKDNKDDGKALHNFRYNFLLRLKEVGIFHPDILSATGSSTSKLFIMRRAKSMLSQQRKLL